MKIAIQLNWLKRGTQPQKGFKNPAAYTLFGDYVKRISHFIPVNVQGDEQNPLSGGHETWICSPAKEAQMLSSEDLSRALIQLQNKGTKSLRVVIGGSEGFSVSQLNDLSPSKKWSFGPLTLPHELAAIVASEQLYRAFTIQHKLPYHLKH